MNISYVYFDLDDTLLDHHQAEKAALNDVYYNFKFDKKVSLDTLTNRFGTINKKLWIKYSNGAIDRSTLQRKRIEDTLHTLGLGTEQWDEVARYYLEAYERHWQWIDGKKQVFEFVADNYPTGLLTNGFTEVQKKKFEKFNFKDFVDHFIISEEIGVMKPQSGIFEHATMQAGVEPGQILYIGDSLHSDVQGGSDFGWNVAWFNRFSETKETKNAVFTYTEPAELHHWMKDVLQ